MKAKKCKVCKEKFEPLRALQMVCSAAVDMSTQTSKRIATGSNVRQR
jgi:hypothetical protein